MIATHKPSSLQARSGHAIVQQGTGLRGVPECPSCAHGLLDAGRGPFMRCNECGATFTYMELAEKNILR